MYIVLHEPQYIAEQRAIEPDIQRLEAALQGLYQVLRHTPQAGERIGETDLFAWPLRVYMGLLPVVVYYRVREEEQIVVMVAIQVSDEGDE